MPPILDQLLNADIGQPASASLIGFELLLAGLIGQVIAWVYQLTHRSLSYSQPFVSSLLVLPVIVALMMVLMAGNVMIAFGLLAVFAMVRFRNVLKDTRDTTFLLWSIVEGLSVGTQRFSTAFMGLVGLSIVFLYLRVTNFGSRHAHDAVLHVVMSSTQDVRSRLAAMLDRHCLKAMLAAERVLPGPNNDCEISYRVLLRDPARHDELRRELNGQTGFSRVSLALHQDDWEA